MQEYKEIGLTDIARDAVMQLQENIKTVASRYSGTAFPTDDLYDGMQCYRKDEGKSYIYNATTQTWDMEAQGNDDLLFSGVHTSSVTEIKCYPDGAQGWDVSFPNVTKIASNALAERAVDGTNTLHFDYHRKKEIKALDGYPLFGSQEGQFNLVFDLNKNGIEMTIDNPSSAEIWVDGEKTTESEVLIQPSVDVTVIAGIGTHFTIDTVNKTNDFTYTATVKTNAGTTIGYNNIYNIPDGAVMTATLSYGSANLVTSTENKIRAYVLPTGTPLVATVTVETDGLIYQHRKELSAAQNLYFSAFEVIDGKNFMVWEDDVTEYVGISEIENVPTSYKVNSSGLIRVDFPDCLTVGLSAFRQCDKLTNVNLPNCTTIETYAFRDDITLPDINLPACQNVKTGAFQNCIKLKNVSLPICEKVYGNAFQNCQELTSIDLPLCKEFQANAFYGCINLESARLPACTEISGNTFGSCLNLTEIHFAAGNQATIEALSGYAKKFGATNATIYFDL